MMMMMSQPVYTAQEPPPHVLSVSAHATAYTTIMRMRPIRWKTAAMMQRIAQHFSLPEPSPGFDGPQQMTIEVPTMPRMPETHMRRPAGNMKMLEVEMMARTSTGMQRHLAVLASGGRFGLPSHMLKVKVQKGGASRGGCCAMLHSCVHG